MATSIPPSTSEPPSTSTSNSPYAQTILPLATFKPTSPSRAWVSIPNPNSIPLLATATAEKTVRVYSLINFTLHSTMDGGHTRSVRAVSWKPDTVKRHTVGERMLTLASGSFDATMAIWRRREGVFAAMPEDGDGEDEIHMENGEDEGLEVEISSMGQKKATPKVITPHIHDEDDDSDMAEDWAFEIVLEGQDSEIKDVAYSPSGQYLASCSRDKSIWIWEEIGSEGEDDFETIAVLQEHTADVKCVSWRKDDGDGEVLASGGYDDTIRLWRGDEEGEWSCVAVLEGHDGTVWRVEWEPECAIEEFPLAGLETVLEGRTRTPRLISSSADCEVRIWSKAPTPPPPNKPSYFNSGIPSTMRPGPTNETWECTSILPKIHDLPIYSVNWSAMSGRVVSTGGDSKIAVYEERPKGRSTVDGKVETEWVVVAVLEGGHGPYEINHVVWCRRYDGGRGREGDGKGEEMIISTGDDGSVKAWIVGKDGAVEAVTAENGNRSVAEISKTEIATTSEETGTS